SWRCSASSTRGGCPRWPSRRCCWRRRRSSPGSSRAWSCSRWPCPGRPARARGCCCTCSSAWPACWWRCSSTGAGRRHAEAVSRPGAWPEGRLRAAWAFLRRVYARYEESRLQMLAASLAYYGAFSLGPLLLLLAGWVALVLRRRPELLAQYRAALVSLLTEALPLQVDAEALVASSFDIVVGDLGRGALVGSALSIVVLVWASSNFFMSLQHALEVVFEVDERRGFWRKRLVSFLLVACVALVVAVEIVGGVALGAVRELAGRVG